MGNLAEGQVKVVKMSSFGSSLGTRELGEEIRQDALLSVRSQGNRMLFDFSGVHVISSAFADELFGKLFVELGRELFFEKIKINKFDTDEDKQVILLIIRKALEYRDTRKPDSSKK